MKTKGERRTTDMAAYLATVPPEFRHALEHLRDTIQRVAPESEPSMRYGVPAFRFRGRPLVCFAAFKSHCGLYPLSPNSGALTCASTSVGVSHALRRHKLRGEPFFILRRVYPVRIAVQALPVGTARLLLSDPIGRAA